MWWAHIEETHVEKPTSFYSRNAWHITGDYVKRIDMKKYISPYILYYIIKLDIQKYLTSLSVGLIFRNNKNQDNGKWCLLPVLEAMLDTLGIKVCINLFNITNIKSSRKKKCLSQIKCVKHCGDKSSGSHLLWFYALSPTDNANHNKWLIDRRVRKINN